MKKENFKLDDDMIARIEQFAQANNLTKSSAIRLLLARALGAEIEDAYISEVVNKIQTVVRGNVGKMLARWQNELVSMLSATLETSAEEITAEIPPVTDVEREIVRARSPGARPGIAKPIAPDRPKLEVMEPEGPGLVEEGEEDDEEAVELAEEPVTAEQLLAEAESLYWENYRTMLAEIGEDSPTEAVADEAARLALRYNPDAVSAGWKPPVWGTEDFTVRKARAFPQGGVRGRR